MTTRSPRACWVPLLSIAIVHGRQRELHKHPSGALQPLENCTLKVTTVAAAALYRRLRAHHPVSESELLALFSCNVTKDLVVHTQGFERRWLRMHKDMTWQWVARQLPGLEDIDPLLGELVLRALLYRTGGIYRCLLLAEDILSIPTLAVWRFTTVQKHECSEKVLSLCFPIAVLLYWWVSRASPPAPNLDALYRIEEPYNDVGWALQWQEHVKCKGPRARRYNLDRCGPTLLQPNAVLTINTSIAFAGDIGRGSFVNPQTRLLSHDGEPWIWTWLKPKSHNYLRWRILPPPGRPHVPGAIRMHFNTLRIQLTQQPERSGGPGWRRNRLEFGFGTAANFDIQKYKPRLDHNEIVLRHGTRLRIERVERQHGGSPLTTVTARVDDTNEVATPAAPRPSALSLPPPPQYSVDG